MRYILISSPKAINMDTKSRLPIQDYGKFHSQTTHDAVRSYWIDRPNRLGHRALKLSTNERTTSTMGHILANGKSVSISQHYCVNYLPWTDIN